MRLIKQKSRGNCDDGNTNELWFFLRAYADAGMLLLLLLLPISLLLSSLLALLVCLVLARKQPSFLMLDVEAFEELGLAMTGGAGNIHRRRSEEILFGYYYLILVASAGDCLNFRDPAKAPGAVVFECVFDRVNPCINMWRG
jgi:hypothetical protein